MIPERESGPRPLLSLELAFLLALLAPLVHLLWTILFEQIGFQLVISTVGMGALVTYGGLLALCASRFRAPPARQLAFVAAPAPAWLAVVFLTSAIVLSSEVDNVVKSLAPPPPAAAELSGALPPFFGVAFALVYIGVYPLVYDVFFRGVLQPLAAARFGAAGGVVLTAAMSGFAEAFMPSMLGGASELGPALPPAFLNALMLCILRQSGGSLWPVLALHVLWGIVLIGAAHHVFGLAGFDGGGAHTPMPWIVGAALLTAVGLGLCRAAARSGSARSSSPAQG
ncbi:MAG TPA: CPBP family glutamic-type intramembrane protease [Myxococcota bacterium]|nr:CPBP family glutamic-type intramembrane protease [Myxococcota bacterium]